MIPDLVSGRVTMTISPIAPLLPLVRAGMLRALAVASVERSAAAPELPTIAESGFPGFETSSWQGLFAPVRTPASIIHGIQSDVVRVTAQPQMRTRFAELGMDCAPGSPGEIAAVIAADRAKWARVIAASGARPE